MSSDAFARQCLRVTVAQICASNSIEHVEEAVLETLVDVMEHCA